LAPPQRRQGLKVWVGEVEVGTEGSIGEAMEV
jgi:hypothetical protein